MSAPRATRALTALLLASLTGLAWLPLRGFLPDDTYIHLQYARHLRDGHGLVFNLGERVYASTSPLWSALLAGLGRLGFDLETAAVAASLACAVAASLVAARVFSRFLPAPIHRFAACAFAVDLWFVRWSGTGMETSLALLLVLLGFERYLATRPWGQRPLAAGTWWALAMLVRPEAAILPVLLAGRVGIEAGSFKTRARRMLPALAPALLCGGLWTAFAWAYFGTPLPVTIHAKALEHRGAPGALRNLGLMATEFAASRPVELVAVVLGAAALLLSRRGATPGLPGDRGAGGWRAHLVPVGWLVGLPLFYATSGVPGVTRYIVPITPLLVAYGWRALARLAPWPAALRVALAVVLMTTAATHFFYVQPQARAFARGLEATWIAQGRWFAAHTPPGTRVALRDIGAFAYFSDRPVVDLGGLVTPAIVPLMRAHDYDELVVGLGFGALARPDYLLDIATEPARMIADSPYAGCLELLSEGRLDHRALRKPEAAWVSAYRIDWACVDAAAGASSTSR